MKRAPIYPVEFRGKAGEWFAIWIANVFLTVVTLGIYSAWAKVRFKKYFYQNTYVGGRNFDYHGRPKNILIGRIIVAVVIALSYVPGIQVVVVPVLILLMPAALVLSARFNARNSSWANVRFDFMGKIPRAYVIYLIYPALAYVALIVFVTATFFVVTKGSSLEPSQLAGLSDTGKLLALLDVWPRLLLAFVISLIVALFFVTLLFRLVQLYAVNGHRLAGLPFSIDARLSEYLGVMYLAVLLGAVGGAALGLVVFALSAVFVYWTAAALPALVVFSYGSLILGYIAFRVGVRNLLFRNLELGRGTKCHRFRSTAQVLEVVGIIVTNAIAVSLSFGLMLPWAKIRYYRYMAENTFVLVEGNLDDFAGDAQDYQNSVGEAYGDFEGLDLGIGL